MKKMPPWSPSSLSNYHTCPRQYEALRVSKRFKQEETEHTIWGNEVHKALELYVAQQQPLPERMNHLETFAGKLAQGSGDVYCELQLGVTEDLQACNFDDKEFCWSRGIIDYLRVNIRKGLAIDFKSGKRKIGLTQLMQNAGLIFAHFPELEELTTAYAWLQENKIDKTKYTRSQFEDIWDYFRKDVQPMEWSYENNAWPANPSGLCGKWCCVIDCEHNGKYRRK